MRIKFFCLVVALLSIAILALSQNPRIGIPKDAGVNTAEYMKGDGSFGTPGGGGLPAGTIVLIVSGSCPSGFSEETTLNGKTLFGTLNASADVGTTGGNDNITPAGTNSGGAVDAHAGGSVADHASHTHDYTQVLNHTHTVDVTDPGHSHTERNNSATTGGLLGWGAADSSTNTAQSTGYTTTSNTTGITASSQNPAGGVATGTTAGPSAALSHSVTQPSNHVVTQPTFAGTSFDNRSAFVRVIFCKKT